MIDMQALTEESIRECCLACEASKFDNLKRGHPSPICLTIFDEEKRIIAAVMSVTSHKFASTNKISKNRCIIGLPRHDPNLLKQFAKQVDGRDMIVEVFCKCGNGWYSWGKGKISEVNLNKWHYEVDRVMNARKIEFEQGGRREKGHKRRRECDDHESMAEEDESSTEEEDEGDADYAPLATRIKHDIELLLVEYDQITETFKQRIRKLLNSFED